MAIEWDRIGQPAFDRIVEALVHRLYDETAEVEVTNGRGGDDGIDILVIKGGHRRIYQLKYFPEGFSSSWGKRRQQIKRSFNSIAASQPYEWILTVPCTVTRSERAYVSSLTSASGIKASILDRSKLDHQLARFPDLEASFTRDLLRENAIIFGQERAMLHNGTQDMIDRVSNLGNVVDQLDDNWTIDFERTETCVTYRLRAKHPRAAHVSRLHVELDLEPRPCDTELLAKASQAFKFGTGEEVKFPREIVKRFELIGPSALSHSISNVEVTLHPPKQAPPRNARVRLQFTDDNDRQLSIHEGNMSHGGQGSQGYSLEASFHGGATLSFLLPFRKTDEAKVLCDFKFRERDPAEALRIASLVTALRNCHRINITVAGDPLGSIKASTWSGTDLPADTELADYVELAEDLEILQRHSHVHFSMPVTMTPRERMELRFARLLVEGHCAIHPGAKVLTIELNGNDSPELRLIFRDEPSSVRLEREDFAIEVAGHVIPLGHVVIFHTQVVIKDKETAIRALENGTAAGLPVELQPPKGQYYRAYLADKVPAPHRALEPTPWILPGIPYPESDSGDF